MRNYLIIIVGCVYAVPVLAVAIKRTIVEISDDSDTLKSPQPSLGRCAGAEVSGQGETCPDALPLKDTK